MSNSNCPHCNTTFRGKSFFTLIHKNGAVECPTCHSTLIVLPNYWSAGGFGVGSLSMLVQLLIDKAEFPILWLALSCIAPIALLFGIVALIYLTKYRLTSHQPSTLTHHSSGTPNGAP